eukprot:GHVU01054221.1.p1 GENE.GHVU01054221.1~~GHVU01054221.1.p1  ORF type:complete len:106 (+),score=0.60 GHVU01054221.1:123-440(+)
MSAEKDLHSSLGHCPITSMSLRYPIIPSGELLLQRHRVACVTCIRMVNYTSLGDCTSHSHFPPSFSPTLLPFFLTGCRLDGFPGAASSVDRAELLAHEIPCSKEC